MDVLTPVLLKLSVTPGATRTRRHSRQPIVL
jgi:hypothetical protein